MRATMRGLILGVAASLTFISPILANGDESNVPTFAAKEWLQDLDQLRDAMTSDYANLEWAAEVRGLSLAASYSKAHSRLESATDQTMARRAIERFIASFADGHLEVQWPDTSHGKTPQGGLCQRLSYSDFVDDGVIASRLAEFQPIPSAGDQHFPAGTIKLNGKRLGILRIPSFSHHEFSDLCAITAAQLDLSEHSTCDTVCADKIGLIVDQRLLDEIATQIRSLVATQPDVLMVDMAGNGGGDDIAIAAARMLTRKRLLGAAMAVVRGPRWAEQLKKDQAVIRAGVRRAKGQDLNLLKGLETALADARTEATASCDRTPLWRDEKISCSQLIKVPFYATGLVATPPIGDYHDPEWGGTVSATSGYRYQEGVWTGPLVILVDGNSASATELVAAMLQDNHAATIIGAPTYGAGCGFALEHKELALTHSGGLVAMPDCVRFRADGRNEVAGIDPDIIIAFRVNDTPQQRARRLEAALPALMQRVGK